MSGVRGTGVRLVVAGVAAQIAGLVVDAWMHGRDPGLAGREDLVTVTNPGHALLLVGLAMTAMGAAALVVGRRAVTLLAGVVVAAAAVGVGLSPIGDHDHAVAAAADAHPASETATTVPGHHHGHGEGSTAPVLSVEDAAALDTELAASRAVAARYPTLGDALAEGFIFGTPYEQLIGAHYLRYRDIDHVFDPSRPEMLLYDGDTPAARLVGLTYYVIAPHVPDGFTGKADRWHQHTQTCITPEGPVFAGDGYRRCRANGRLSWMLHAWVVDGFDSPHGVFSAENVRLR